MEKGGITIKGISIHAPTRGATQENWSIRCRSSFQSTLPQGERLAALHKNCHPITFQSTLPQGERRYGIPDWSIVAEPISIHAPTRGATKRRDFSRHVKNFNPRSHKGSDANPDPKFLAFSYFNPRSHKGSDKLDEDINGEHEISIHAPTRGATAILHKIPYLFYFIFTNPFPISYFHTQPASDF